MSRLSPRAAVTRLGGRIQRTPSVESPTSYPGLAAVGHRSSRRQVHACLVPGSSITLALLTRRRWRGRRRPLLPILSCRSPPAPRRCRHPSDPRPRSSSGCGIASGPGVRRPHRCGAASSAALARGFASPHEHRRDVLAGEKTADFGAVSEKDLPRDARVGPTTDLVAARSSPGKRSTKSPRPVAEFL